MIFLNVGHPVSEDHVLSSDYEGSPNVLLEARRMGMHCISTDCPSGGLGELIVDSVNGLLVPVGEEHALAEAMDKLADTVYAKTLADNAYRIRGELTRMAVFEDWYEYLFGEMPINKQIDIH